MAERNFAEIRGISDPVLEGINKGWRTLDASHFKHTQTFTADVVIIGSGAGGGTSAEVLAKAGLKVILIEAGPLKTSNDFDMDETRAYQNLYQEHAGRMNKDGSLSILQGRCVGGSTVVNWTSSFRTPEPTLQYWQSQFQLKGCSVEDMAPWFEKMEKRLNISPWSVPPNENNAVLSRGAETLGIPWKVIPRNVIGCWNLGFCGTGCPTNAKQSMLVTTIPAALEQGSQLIYNARAEQLIFDDKKQKVMGLKVKALLPLDNNNAQKNDKHKALTFDIKADAFVLAAGGINSPALLLRSDTPDPKKRIGKRTFLHPVAFSFAKFDQEINPYYGAPQSVYSDHYQWQSVTGEVGYKLEVPPLHPSLTSALLLGHGPEHVKDMQALPNLNAMIALMRDGFNEESIGGSIELADDGSPIIDYPINDYLWQGIKASHLNMAELQFAAGATAVKLAHIDSQWYRSWQECQAAIQSFDYIPCRPLVGSAHVMGGLAMGEDLEQCLVDSQGKYHYLENLYVFDGSVFPTSIGANPQLSIYGLACKNASLLAQKMR